MDAKSAYPQATERAVRKPSPVAGSPAYADLKKVRELREKLEEIQRTEALSTEEKVASALMGNRKTDIVSGWTFREVFQILETGMDHPMTGNFFCKEERRRKCKAAGTCIQAEGGMNLRSEREAKMTPEEYFAKCRKVTVQQEKVVKEEFDGAACET
jgi:hypothetical protein